MAFESESLEFREDVLICEKHLDTFGHVNNAVYLELYEQARWNFITEGGFGLEEVKKLQIGPIILELNLTFKAEITNRETITITSKFREMKNSLVMILDQQMVKSDGTVASQLKLHAGIMDLQKRKLIRPTPQWFRAIGLSDEEIKEISQQ